MKLFKVVLLVVTLSPAWSYAADSPIELPSSIPVDVFKMDKNQRGLGYIGFNVNLELEDDFFKDRIGDVEFESQGFIYTTPGEGALGFLGEMFELSYTVGVIDGQIIDPSFTANGFNYNNTYDKDGFYIGFRPSYSRDLNVGDGFKLKSSTTLHAFFYSVSGAFSVNNGTNAYRYNEDNYGLALKPTTVLQGTFYPTSNFALTLYGGLSTFVAIDWVFYDDGAFDEDNEADFLTSGINPVFGYDLSYRFSNGSVFNVSSILSQRENDDSLETVIRYLYSF
jgi:hypothetical protein